MMAGGGGAKIQRAHYNTASDRAFEAAPQNTTIKLCVAPLITPSPLNITINYRRQSDKKGTGEVSEGRMLGEGRGGRKLGGGRGGHEINCIARCPISPST